MNMIVQIIIAYCLLAGIVSGSNNGFTTPNRQDVLSSIHNPTHFGSSFQECSQAINQRLNSLKTSSCYESTMGDASEQCYCEFSSAVYNECGSLLNHDPKYQFVASVLQDEMCCSATANAMCFSEAMGIQNFILELSRILIEGTPDDLNTYLHKSNIPFEALNSNEQMVHQQKKEKRDVFEFPAELKHAKFVNQTNAERILKKQGKQAFEEKQKLKDTNTMVQVLANNNTKVEKKPEEPNTIAITETKATLESTPSSPSGKTKEDKEASKMKKKKKKQPKKLKTKQKKETNNKKQRQNKKQKKLNTNNNNKLSSATTTTPTKTIIAKDKPKPKQEQKKNKNLQSSNNNISLPKKTSTIEVKQKPTSTSLKPSKNNFSPKTTDDCDDETTNQVSTTTEYEIVTTTEVEKKTEYEVETETEVDTTTVYKVTKIPTTEVLVRTKSKWGEITTTVVEFVTDYEYDTVTETCIDVIEFTDTLIEISVSTKYFAKKTITEYETDTETETEICTTTKTISTTKTTVSTEVETTTFSTTSVSTKTSEIPTTISYTTTSITTVATGTTTTTVTASNDLTSRFCVILSRLGVTCPTIAGLDLKRRGYYEDEMTATATATATASVSNSNSNSLNKPTTDYFMVNMTTITKSTNIPKVTSGVARSSSSYWNSFTSSGNLTNTTGGGGSIVNSNDGMNLRIAIGLFSILVGIHVFMFPFI
ncbi:hypothetical protein CANARDRAFT_24054 [[Candida] arabinofermentans NRRL YB-2248]|uniref:Extracellular membrane protein CFEM domain-containing protein n=1 Tax=[Candida] arabinofermentans NRRL YB-2248 TaxID=983967 RepID=A0A1E4SXQ8_9ASCO|nr:hypothetical protein CANARDRAFT_24054 [[Candida] arabinofermentans NRRL YB-2248]